MPYKRMQALVLALLAATPAGAQVRATQAAIKASLPAAPSVSVSAALPALAASPLTAAPALTPALVTPAAPAALTPAARVGALAEAARPALEALAPAEAGRVSGEQASVLAARAMGLDEAVRTSEAAAVLGGWSAASAPLPPSDGPRVREARAPVASSRPHYAARRPGVLRSLEAKLHYAKRLSEEYYWYSVTHISGMWPSYKDRWNKAREAGHHNVTYPRAFFTHMRVAGTSGKFYVLGISPLADEAVITSFRQAYLTWFHGRSVGPAELAAFDRFTDRARIFNAERRAPTNMRKHIRDALIKASTMEPAKIASFFDSLLVEETARETADFQNKGAQKRIFDAFTKAVRDTLEEEDPKGKDRVLAVIVMGSFASGSAGPKSDFDVEVITRGGRIGAVPAFTKRLTDRWIAAGHHKNNPVGVHEHPYKPMREVVDMVHAGDYLVVSLDERLADALQRKPGEAARFEMQRRHTPAGAMGRLVQSGIIYGSTFLGDLKHLLGLKTAGH